MRISLGTAFMVAVGAIALPTAAILAIGRVEHWSFNETTCMPVGFYQRGPRPAHLHDGDMVFVCPAVRETLRLPFTGSPRLLADTPKGVNPAIHEAISGFWLERTKVGLWHCPDGLVPFAKKVVATAGQRVTITKAGVLANGRLLPNSQIVTRVSGIPVIHLPIGFSMTIPAGYFWDYAPGTAAFTSAYYGPVPVKNILGSLKPALTIPGSQYWYGDKIKTQ